MNVYARSTLFHSYPPCMPPTNRRCVAPFCLTGRQVSIGVDVAPFYGLADHLYVWAKGPGSTVGADCGAGLRELSNMNTPTPITARIITIATIHFLRLGRIIYALSVIWRST
jgi:hypothetical protein